ncbi:LysR family transcriptional regulator [Sphingomonas crocodyli]|uniref:LysR family transcriptional regulator n=1 Tax=Sphingomonas crocodyli TaxID=1979270 RepID=A0A437M5Z3_9SPHN|nr:LysR family transcriptional regulator [Sphingomonas crocodyli]RVT93059.1 LysR family transcriptional regulator [Sphingomonas crocodyli]
MRFDLVDLRLFVAIVEAGSISKGAEKVHLALASASARVSGMEAMLGVALLDRGRRGVVPTAAGRSLLHHARSIGAAVEQMRGDLRGFATGLKGSIRMLSNTAALVELLPAALRSFLATHPDVDIDIEERTSADIVAAIAEGRAEFGVIANSADSAMLETIALASDKLVLIAPAAHPLSSRDTVAFAELLEEPFVGLSAGALHSHLADHAARLGRRINYRVRLRSFDAVARLVEAGVGLGIVPLAAAALCRATGIATIPLSDGWADRELLICAADFKALSPHARLFVDHVVGAARAPI